MKYKKVYIEITNICNLSCSFCQKSSREKQFMTLIDFELYLKQIKEYTDYIYLHVKGEPLAHPEFDKIIEICEKYSMKVNITTNGMLINKWKDIIEKSMAIRQINFSLHSYIEYNLFDISEILHFVDIIKERIIISFRFWNLKDSMIGDKNFVLIDQIFKKFNKEFDNDLFFSKMSYKISDNVYINHEYEFDWPSYDLIPQESGFCYGLRTHFGVLVDGTVIPCCLDGEGLINLGNLKVLSLNQITASERVKAIYDGFSDKKAVEKLCKHCTFKNKFNEKH